MTVLAFGPPAALAQAPPEFEDLHAELVGAIAGFRRTIAESWDGSRAPVAFSANLMSASAARGPALLAPDALQAAVVEIDSLKALGVKAINLHLDFPMLHRPFHGDADYSRYLDYYRQVVAAIRDRGLRVIVETQTLFSRGGFSYWDVGPYYDSLSLAEYRAGRMAVARTIASELRPDYLSVIQEPDTEAEQSRKPELGTPEGSRTLLDVILAGLETAAVPDVAVGAGIGTWQDDHRAFVESFASTAIDYLDMHVYPVTRDFLSRAFEIADVAAAHGKAIAMSEAWLYKARDVEIDVLDFTTIFSRDTFGFWGPLDSFFVRTMVEFAHARRLAFFSPFWTGYFHGYLDYDATTADLPADELNRLAQERQAANLRGAVYTPTAMAYRSAIVVPADTAAPAAPPDLSAQLASATSAALTWSPSDDAVGTAGYAVFRNGQRLARTAMTHYADSGLSEATKYVYAVVAYDLSGNVSPPSTAAVTMPDTTPPSAPAGFDAAATLAGSRIDIRLSWSPSVDNVGVTQYLLLRGESPDALGAIAAPAAPPFTITDAPPDTTYYFAVSAADAAWNQSPQVVTSVTTPPILDRTPPTVRMAYPSDGATVSGTAHLYAVAYDLQGGTWDVPSREAAVQFRINGVDIGAEQVERHSGTDAYSVFRLEADVRHMPRGQHTITAVARDHAGNTAVSAPVTVTISRP